MSNEVCSHVMSVCCSCNTADESHLEPATAAAVATANSLSDISEYLKDIPLDWLSDAANLLSHTLQFTCLSPNLLSSDVSNGNSAGVDDVEVSAIVRGAKQVCVPPGQHCTRSIRHYDTSTTTTTTTNVMD